MAFELPIFLNSVVPGAISTALGLLAALVTIRLDRRKSINQELIKKRIDVFSKMSPYINDIMCFCVSIGDWKSISPPEIISIKRRLDREFYVNRFLFSKKTFSSYNKFMNRCFDTYRGDGLDALIRADLTRIKRQWGALWLEDWSSFFSSPALGREEFLRLHDDVLRDLAADIGVRFANR